MGSVGGTRGQFHRVDALDRKRISCTVDGALIEALEGDTVLVALMTLRRHLRRFEFGEAWRSGFCLMGACQDCWLRLADGTPLRACTTPLEDGMALVTEGHDDA